MSPTVSGAPRGLVVRTISAREHLGFVRTGVEASYLQCPSWAGVKLGWRTESVGWFAGNALIGVALVSYRDAPVVGCLAYVGEGPVLDWAQVATAAAMTALLDFLRDRRVFTVRMTPNLVLHRWAAATLRAGLTSPNVGRLADLPPDHVDPVASALTADLRALGWRHYQAPGPGFGGRMHPRYRAHVRLGDGRQVETLPDASWRRNLRRSTAEVALGTAEDLPTWHRIYTETGLRDGFPPLPLTYFERLWRQLSAEDPERVRLYLARVQGEVHAAALAMRVGSVSSYVYGASTTAGRAWRPSNALQWRMLTDAAESGATLHDLRGISDTLDLSDPLVGLLRFKLGMGADAVELVGEWEYALRPVRHRLVAAYLDRR